MVMKPEVKDRIMSHEHPVTAAIYNSKFNQVSKPNKRQQSIKCLGSVFNCEKNFKTTFPRTVAMSQEPQELRGIRSDRVKLNKLVVLDVSHLMTVVLVDKGKWFRINQSIDQSITKPKEVLCCVFLFEAWPLVQKQKGSN